MSSDAESHLSAGTMLDDKYRIERLLAAGSMGEVYLGTHTRLRKRVAIKILNPQLSSAPMIERFHREAINASQIGHEGIAQVTDIGTSLDGEPFLVMEYLEGESLASRLRAQGPLPVEDACELGCAILSPLAAAHDAGIVHRDLKPDNVFLVRQSRGEMIKLLDFGISRGPGLASEFRLTSTGLVLGTPYYMAPEQARGESQITPAADLYAFGVMLYEMLAGDVPIQADNYNQLMYRVMTGEFPRPRERRPDLPEGLEQIILQAMAQSPADRPASASAIEQALLAFCRPVFREHVTGRISAPGLVLGTALPGGRAGDAGLDPRLFAGPTIQETRRDDVHPLPALPALPGDGSAEHAVPQAGEPVERESQPVLHMLLRPMTPAPTEVDDDTSSRLAAATRRSPARWIPIGVAGAVAAGALVLVFARGGDDPVAVAPHPRAPAPPAGHALAVTGGSPGAPGAPAAPGAPPAPDRRGSATLPGDNPAEHQPATVMIKFAVAPPGATITVDGTRVNGREIMVPRDAAPHRLRITAAGYLGHDEAISFDESQRLVVQLTHAPPTRGQDPRQDNARTDGIESKSPYE